MYSMTGFGKASAAFPEYEINIEIKSVNHRFIDIQCRVPSHYAQFEPLIREKIKEKIKRGRIECYVVIKSVEQENQQVMIHWERLTKFVQEIQEGWEERFGGVLSDEVVYKQAMAQGEWFMELTDSDERAVAEKDFLQVLDLAINHFQQSRAREGAALQQTLKGLCAELPKELQKISEKREAYIQEAFSRLQEKIEELLHSSPVDESRLLTEVAILIDKSDIQEEIDRMSIHIEQLRNLLQMKEPVGRELDFLIQEMNREVNTIGSKSMLIEIKNAVVQLKSVLEKIREQIQNVE